MTTRKRTLAASAGVCNGCREHIYPGRKQEPHKGTDGQVYHYVCAERFGYLPGQHLDPAMMKGGDTKGGRLWAMERVVGIPLYDVMPPMLDRLNAVRQKVSDLPLDASLDEYLELLEARYPDQVRLPLRVWRADIAGR